VFSATYAILKALPAHTLDCIAAAAAELYLELISIVKKENLALQYCEKKTQCYAALWQI
jgi:hypothetical protein